MVVNTNLTIIDNFQLTKFDIEVIKINKIWSTIVILSIIYMFITSNAEGLIDVLSVGTADAVELIISLVGIMAMWGGFMEIAERSGVTAVISRILSPLINWLFKDAKIELTKNAISMNITANLLGLGNAATPLGIEAMQRMNIENNKSIIASDAMVTFVILNTASVQIVPVTTAALRSSYGSKQPMVILLPVLCASVCALAVGLICDMIFRRSLFND